MHQAGILGESFSDAKEYGWHVRNDGHDWNKMVTSIQDHIGSLNFGYRTALRDNGVTYLNAFGSFIDAHTLAATKKNGKIETMTANRILIAVGGRPSYLDVPGAEECCITSDDIFSLPEAPGRTLCVGASYISLETAGFLTALGYDTTVAIRSIPLRGFDTEIAEKIVGYMERHGTKFMRDSQPCAFEKRAGGKIAVKVKNTVFGNEFETEFDTVILAVGRHAVTAGLNLGAAGVRVNTITPGFFPAEQNRKILFHEDGSPTARTESIMGHTPMGRFGEAEELIGAAVFLASHQASSFVTGSDIRVDGGFLSQTI